MVAGQDDKDAEIEKLKIEIEGLRARLIVAKGARRPQSSISGLQWKWNAAHWEAEARRDGFDPSTPGGYEAWHRWKHRVAERAAPPPKPAEEMIAGGLQPFSEPAVRQHTFEEIVATPEAILRAEAIARGEVVDLPSDPTARAILRAAAKAKRRGPWRQTAMTKFRTGPLPIRPDAWVLSLDEQIASEAKRRANAEARQRFRSKRIYGAGKLRPGADLGSEIVAAYNKARREQGDEDDPHDDDRPSDDEPELRGPPQTQTVATPSAILAAAKKAGFL